MKLSTFVRHIRDYQYAEYGTDLIGKIRLINGNTVELETIISNSGHDFMIRFCEQIKSVAGKIQYQISRGVNRTGIDVEIVSINRKSKAQGICRQQFEVRI